MLPQLTTYLPTQRTSVVAIEMLDGSPHASTLHFAHTENPFQFIFLTERAYRKAEPLLKKESVRATVVVGTQEADMKTLQMDGVARVTDNPELIDAYYKKFTDKDRTKLDEDDFFFVFTPAWWRFIDWTTPEGKTSFDSNGETVVFGKS